MAQLIIHIGPPKTATTSLQHYFNDIKVPGLKYLGIIQPRLNSEEDTCFTGAINDFLNLGGEKLKKKLRKIISRELTNNSFVIISEEAFVFNQRTASISKKLNRLNELFGIYDPVISLAVRNAEQVYFSYFIEIGHLLTYDLQKSFSMFQDSSYCDCYKYEKFHGMIKSAGFEKIFFFSYQKLISGDLTLKEILGVEGLELTAQVILAKKNITKIKNSDLVMVQHGYFKELLFKYTPKSFRGLGLGKLYMKFFKDAFTRRIKKQAITSKTRSIYESDLSFLKQNGFE